MANHPVAPMCGLGLLENPKPLFNSLDDATNPVPGVINFPATVCPMPRVACAPKLLSNRKRAVSASPAKPGISCSADNPRASKAATRCAVPSSQTAPGSGGVENGSEGSSPLFTIGGCCAKLLNVTPEILTLVPATDVLIFCGVSVTARFVLAQSIEPAKSRSLNARNDHVFTSSGIGFVLMVIPSGNVPVQKKPPVVLNMASIKLRACCACVLQKASPVNWASMVKRANASMLCSVDLNVTRLLPPSTPPVKPPAPIALNALFIIHWPSLFAPSRKRWSEVRWNSWANAIPVHDISPFAEPMKKKGARAS